jgi:hypothetical protein
VRLAIAFAALAACTFSKHVDATTDATIPAPDGGPCAAKSDECVNADVLRSCAGKGAMYVDKTCAWGCKSDHCGIFTPAANVVTAMAAAADTSALADLVLPAGTIVNASGAIGTMSNATSIRNTMPGTQNMIDYAVATGGVVFTVKKLRIAGDISLVGAKSIAIVATDEIVIEGVVDARGPCMFDDDGGSAGPGGFAGGAKGTATAAEGSGGGTGGGAGAGNNARGGGGGGHGGAGGAGGDATAGAAGGQAFDPTTMMLVGGGGGGGGGGGAASAPGGGGGGALQLISNTRIEIKTGAGINAGGCGGFSPSGNADSGGGGGAGGMIILEAPDIRIDGQLAVNGGGGGGGADQMSMPGEHGRIDRVAALGKVGVGTGGAGGFGLSIDGLPGTFTTKSGGGGGAVGRMLFNTRDDAHLMFDNSKLSPSFMDPGTTCKRGSANVL